MSVLDTPSCYWLISFDIHSAVYVEQMNRILKDMGFVRFRDCHWISSKAMEQADVDIPLVFCIERVPRLDKAIRSLVISKLVESPIDFMRHMNVIEVEQKKQDPVDDDDASVDG